MTFYSIVRLRDGGGRTGGRVVGTGSGCVQRRSGSSPAFGLGSGSGRGWAVAVGEATAFRAVIGQEVTGWRMVAVRRLCRRRRRLEDRRTGRGGLKRLRAAEVRVPARVWARSGLRLRAELSDRGKAAPGCAKQGGVVAARMEYPRSCGMGRRAASEGRKTERVKATGTTKKPTVA